MAETAEQAPKIFERDGKLYQIVPCSKCGGRRVIEHYRYYAQGVCFKCGGTGTEERRYFTPEHRAKLDKANAYRRAKAQEKRAVQAAEHAAREAEREARRAAIEAERQAARDAAPPWSDGRATIEGTVVKLKYVDGYMGGHDIKAMVLLDDGRRAYGTVPRGWLPIIRRREPGEYDLYTQYHWLTGARVSLTATFEQSRDDHGMAWFKRPKGELLTLKIDCDDNAGIDGDR